MPLRIGGESPRFSGNKTITGTLTIGGILTVGGQITAIAGTNGVPGIKVGPSGTCGFYAPQQDYIGFVSNTAKMITISQGRGLLGNKDLEIGWTASGTDFTSAPDTKFMRSAAGSITISGIGNGQALGIKQLTELTTIANAATTDTAIALPAAALIMAVSVRNTVAIPTAATYTVTGATSGTVFNTVGVAVAIDTTDAGTKSCVYYNAASQLVRITPDLTPANSNGRVRVTIHYLDITPPTT